MSVVIVGGNDCMVCQYKNICKKFDYKAKVFTQVPSDFKSKIGSPDLVEVVRSHTSSSSALRSILQARAERCAL